MDDFKDHPVSITEARSDMVEKDSGTVWTPRDALIRMLRQIDAGEIKPDVLIICYRDIENKSVSYKQASPDMYTTIGVIEDCKFEILKGQY